MKIFFHEFRFSWVLVTKNRVLYEKASIRSYLFVSNVGFSIFHDLTSLALSEVTYVIFTQKWPKMSFLWKYRNSCQNHKICSRMVWKWVPHDLSELLGPYQFWIFEKKSNFFLKDFSKDFSLRILLRASVSQYFPLTFLSFFNFYKCQF